MPFQRGSTLDRRLAVSSFVVGALFASVGVHAQDADVEKSMEPYVACVIRAAEALDDRTSDARSVVRAIIPVCSAKFQAVRAIASRDAPGPRQRAQLLKKIR